ncbi:dihydrofolate reductase family protein [Actinoplanes sp. NPDC023714]|uniref:dihydrofolate reductase family protein n=1 Tax=Actinoplanes sp. NPDC023714 TaxID=3154322 RepID=UPI0033D60EBC
MAGDRRPAERLAPFTFVHDGVESAVRQAEAAGNGDVSVSGPDIAQQCLNAGLLDEVRIDLVPVLLGEGIRYFDHIDNDKARLERVERYRVNYRGTNARSSIELLHVTRPDETAERKAAAESAFAEVVRALRSEIGAQARVTV